MLSCFDLVQLFATLWTVQLLVTHQALLSMGFSRQEYWSGLPFPPPEDLPNPGIKLTSFTSPALAGWFFTTSTIWEVPLFFRELLKCSPLWNSSYSLKAPYLYTCCFLTFECPFSILFLAILTHPSNLNPNINTFVKPSLNYPSPCLSTLHDVYSISEIIVWAQVSKFECKVTNMEPWIAICYFLINP